MHKNLNRSAFISSLIRHTLTASIIVLSACSTLTPPPVVVAPTPQPEPTNSVENVPTPQDQSAQQTPAAELPAPSIISIAAVGDLMLGSDFPKNTLPDDDGVSSLQYAAPILQNVDLALGNLEGVLQDGGKPVKQCKNPKACYLFRSPSRYAKLFSDAGFDVMNLANNHARDFGEDGRGNSMKVLSDVGIAHTGRFGDIAQLRVKDRSVAVIGFAPNMGAHQLNQLQEARQLVSGLASVNDIVIVMFHGGAEGNGAEKLPFKHELFEGEDRGDVVEFAHAMIDAGADVILGSGPHVPRAVELYKERLIAYSLGNFATHFGISVNGNSGVAPLLTANIDEQGRALDAAIHSFVQRRPNGPQPDEAQSALKLIKRLSLAAFPQGQLQFNDDGTLLLPPPLAPSLPENQPTPATQP